MQNSLHANLDDILQSLDQASRAADRPQPRLVAVSKFQAVTAVAELADAWRSSYPGQTPAFGENYVQEAQAKITALADTSLEWHLIGHLQSNKAAQAANLFDWIQTVDRPKLARALAAARDPLRPALNVLLQVNIDAEPGKHGCSVDAVQQLAALVAAEPQLALRGLMAIPAPFVETARRRAAFRRMRALFEALHVAHPQIDTLSMGMSDDAALAVAEGATMVRIGTALFGARPAPPAQATSASTQ